MIALYLSLIFVAAYIVHQETHSKLIAASVIGIGLAALM